VIGETVVISLVLGGAAEWVRRAESSANTVGPILSTLQPKI
jgi:ABC-type phosphate transport system permease subunit